MPLNHLIPRIPQRINYALWIEDLIKHPNLANGVDIGCGSSCIYALISCSMNKEWHFDVSDINDENILSSEKEFSPLSGSESEYNPNLWNNDESIKSSHNCYSYAFGKIVKQLKSKNFSTKNSYL